MNTDEDGLIAIDERGVIESIDPVAGRIFGYPPDEAVGRHVTLLIPAPEQDRPDGDRSHEPVTGWAKILGVGPRAAIGRRKDGTTLPLSVAVAEMQISGARRFIGVVRAGTERQRDPLPLNESEATHRLLLENIDEVVYMIAFDGDPFRSTVQFVSARARDILGYTPDEFLRQRGLWFSILHPDDVPTVMESTQTIYASGRAGVREYRLKHKTTGEYRWMEDHVVPQRASSGAVVSVLGVARDITDRKRVEQALRVSEAQFRNIIDVSPIPYALNDDQQNVTYVNPAFVRTFGYDLNDIPTLSKWWPQAYPNIDYRCWVAAAWDTRLNRARREGSVFEPIEVDIRCKDESVRTALVSAVPLQEAFDGVHLVILYDITDRKRAEEALRESAQGMQLLSRRLVDNQEMERRSLALELHDQVGQLLTFLKLRLELASQKPAEHHRAALGQALTLTADLIDTVRAISLRLRPAILDDLGLLPALLWQADQFRAQSGITVDCRHSGLERRLPPAVETAAFRIAQEALTNVVRHAGVKAATLEARCGNGRLVLTIEDAGRGFDPSRRDLARIGLSGMRERTEALHGTLTIESRLRAGTRIIAELPVESDPASEKSGELDAEPRGHDLTRNTSADRLHPRFGDATNPGAPV